MKQSRNCERDFSLHVLAPQPSRKPRDLRPITKPRVPMHEFPSTTRFCSYINSYRYMQRMIPRGAKSFTFPNLSLVSFGFASVCPWTDHILLWIHESRWAGVKPFPYPRMSYWYVVANSYAYCGLITFEGLSQVGAILERRRAIPSQTLRRIYPAWACTEPTLVEQSTVLNTTYSYDSLHRLKGHGQREGHAGNRNCRWWSETEGQSYMFGTKVLEIEATPY